MLHAPWKEGARALWSAVLNRYLEEFPSLWYLSDHSSWVPHSYWQIFFLLPLCIIGLLQRKARQMANGMEGTQSHREYVVKSGLIFCFLNFRHSHLTSILVAWILWSEGMRESLPFLLHRPVTLWLSSCWMRGKWSEMGVTVVHYSISYHNIAGFVSYTC